jgi:hypothetical protein
VRKLQTLTSRHLTRALRMRVLMLLELVKGVAGTEERVAVTVVVRIARELLSILIAVQRCPSLTAAVAVVM